MKEWKDVVRADGKFANISPEIVEFLLEHFAFTKHGHDISSIPTVKEYIDHEIGTLEIVRRRD